MNKMNSIPFLQFDFQKTPDHLFDLEFQNWKQSYSKLSTDWHDLSQESLIELAHARLRSSQTLRRQTHYEAWIHSNQYVQQKIDNNEKMTWLHICQINQILRGSSDFSLFRKKEVSLVKNHFCPSDQLSLKIKEFERVFLNKADYSIIDIFWIRMWLLNFHPFEDANGRTSQLCADWLLMRLGYPPLTYQNPQQAWIIIFDSNPSEKQLLICFQMFLESLRNSFKIIQPA